MPAQNLQDFPASGVPDARGAILASGSDLLAVLAVGDGSDGPFMTVLTAEGQHLVARRGVPDLHGAVEARRSHPLAVGREHQAGDEVRVSLETQLRAAHAFEIEPLEAAQVLLAGG